MLALLLVALVGAGGKASPTPQPYPPAQPVSGSIRLFTGCIVAPPGSMLARREDVDWAHGTLALPDGLVLSWFNGHPVRPLISSAHDASVVWLKAEPVSGDTLSYGLKRVAAGQFNLVAVFRQANFSCAAPETPPAALLNAFLSIVRSYTPGKCTEAKP